VLVNGHIKFDFMTCFTASVYVTLKLTFERVTQHQQGTGTSQSYTTSALD